MTDAIRHSVTQCPACGALSDTSVGILHNGPPKPGDYTVCHECAAVLRIQEDGTCAAVASLEEVPEACKPALVIARTMVGFNRALRRAKWPRN